MEINDKTIHICNTCSKSFYTHGGLWKHKKKCIGKENIEISIQENENEKQIIPEPTTIDNNLVFQLINQNSDFQKLIVEQNKQIMDLFNTQLQLQQNQQRQNINNNNNNNSFINTNNKTFNIQSFLNDKCKNAINLNEFIQSIYITLNDVAKVGELGYMEGITRILLNELKKIDICKRPIHCCDLKRETFYVKVLNEWNKITYGNYDDNLIDVIKKVSTKNIHAIKDWQDANPDYNNPNNSLNDKYLHIVIEAMGIHNKEEEIKVFNKIITRLAKLTFIDKDNFSREFLFK